MILFTVRLSFHVHSALLQDLDDLWFQKPWHRSCFMFYFV